MAWAETCAITGTPIDDGERVVMLFVIGDAAGKRWENLLTYGEYLRIAERGTYDSFGWIKERVASDAEQETRAWLRTIFVRENVWDAVVKHVDMVPSERERMIRMAQANLRGDGPEPITDHKYVTDEMTGDTISVFVFCQRCRMTPYRGLSSKGQQCMDVTPLRFLSTLVLQECDKIPVPGEC